MSTCSASITFKTDRRMLATNASGASHFEVWREDKKAAEEAEEQQAAEEADAMKNLRARL